MQNQYRVFVVKTQYEEWKNNVYIVADIHTRDVNCRCKGIVGTICT